MYALSPAVALRDSGTIEARGTLPPRSDGRWMDGLGWVDAWADAERVQALSVCAEENQLAEFEIARPTLMRCDDSQLPASAITLIRRIACNKPWNIMEKCDEACIQSQKVPSDSDRLRVIVLCCARCLDFSHVAQHESLAGMRCTLGKGKKSPRQITKCDGRGWGCSGEDSETSMAGGALPDTPEETSPDGCCVRMR